MQRSRFLTSGGLAAVTSIFIVFVLAVPAPASASSAVPPAMGPLTAAFDGSPPSCETFCLVPTNLTLAPGAASINLSNVFWGTTVSPRSRLLPNEGTLINATPTQIIVYPGANAGEHYDPLINRFWKNGHILAAPPQDGIAEFVNFCRSIHCLAIMQVPGEIDNASFAAKIVSYVEKNLSFDPAYWEIGNEPELWSCWEPPPGLPWNDWGSTDCAPKHTQTMTPTPMQYASEVMNYSIAMRAVDPNIHLIGIPATGRANGPYQLWQWIRATVLLNAPNLSAVAFHEYPVSKSKILALDDFYATITPISQVSLPWRFDNVTEAIRNAVAEQPNLTCRQVCDSRIKIFVTEIGSGLSHGANQVYIQSFSGALNLAAQMTQAMSLNITNLDLFAAVLGTANSWFNFTGTWVRPDYAMYTDILKHLGTEAFPVNFTTAEPYCEDYNNLSMCENLYGIGTLDPAQNDRSDLLLINLNTTNTSVIPAGEVQLPGPGDSVIPATNHPIEIWTWQANYSDTFNSSTSSPIPRFFPDGLGAPLELPGQSVTLIETYPQGGVPVEFHETGFTLSQRLGPRWYVELGGFLSEANATTNLTFFEPAGQFPLSVDPIPLPLGGIERVAKERYEPFYPPTVTVGATPVSVNVPFVEQWNVSVAGAPGEPSQSGYVSPTPSWWNASAPLTVAAHPGYGYALSDWTVFENWTGTQTNVTRNWFDGAQAAQDIWINDTDHSFTNITGATPSLTTWVNDSIVLSATFQRAFPITFVENGLAPGTAWSVAVRTNWDDTTTYMTRYDDYYWNSTDAATNASYSGTWTNSSVPTTKTTPTTTSTPSSSVTDSVGISEPNGTFGFTVGTVPGYRSLPVGANFTVAGGRVVVQVNFTPTTPPGTEYPVSFVEAGLPNGTPWSITVRNQSVTSTNTSLGFEEIAGSYGYIARTIVGYGAHPPSSGFYVNNSSTVVPIQFGQERYPVIWEESGLGNVSWNVDLSGDPIASNGAWTSDPLPNGSYSFTIPNVGDFIPTPRTGSVTVSGTGKVFPVQFVEAAFPVTFQATGGPAGADWSIRLSDSALTETANSAKFLEPNGTYSFNVTPPAGYAAVPSHGIVIVDADPTVVSVSFQTVGLPPIPPVWSLALPALGVGVIIALAGWGTFALVGARKRRRPGAKP